jgi:hypothetical protein
MKKIYSLSLSLIIGGFAMAQTAQTTKAFTKDKMAKPTKIIYQEKSDPIWSDDFSDPTTWNIEHDASACDLDWEIGTNLSCGGSYPITTIASTSYDNGCAMVDSDEYGGEEGGADIEDSWITMASPVDLSGYANVILQFESWYRSYNSEKCFIVTSTNGTDWPELTPGFDASTNPNVYDAFPGISGTSGEELPSNPTLWRTNISASAGNQSQVWVRFHWTGTWGYAWFIDDVAILEQPQNDIVLNSGYSSNSSGIEYGRTPSKQLPDTLYMGGVINNFGIDNQNNVTTDIIISDASGNTVVSTSASQAMLENDSTVVLEAIVTDFNFNEGLYSLSVEASSDLDNTSGSEYSNNSYSRNFEITNNIYSIDGIGVYDNPTVSSLGSNSFTDDPNGMVLMTMYTIEETTEISGLEIGITSTSMEDGLVFPFIIGYDAWAADDPYDRIVENYDGVMVTQYNIDNNVLWAPLEPTTLEPGIYFACVELYSDDINHVRILDDETVAQPNGASTIFLPSDVDQTIYTNGTGFAIRMGADGYVDLEEQSKFNNFDVLPNPSNGIFTVSLKDDDNYTIEVSNVLGEIIMFKSIEGIMNETFDISSFSAGAYLVKVSNHEFEQTQRIIIE